MWGGLGEGKRERKGGVKLQVRGLKLQVRTGEEGVGVVITYRGGPPRRHFGATTAPPRCGLCESLLISVGESDPVGRRSHMPQILFELDPETEQDVPGPRWHKPSKRFIAEMGYHLVNEVEPNGNKTTKRVRTTHYLGCDRVEATDKYFQVRKNWIATRNEQRTAYDQEQARRRNEQLELLGRFKAVWAKTVERTVTAVQVVVPQQPLPPVVLQPLYPVAAFTLQAEKEKAEIFILTIKQACDRYLPQQKARIGLHGGKGINEESFKRHKQNLITGLAMNKNYCRQTKPIDVTKRLCDLTRADYESFVQFWCNPNHVKSERTSKNYTGAFSRMLKRLKVPLPDDVDDLFRVKFTKPTKIVRYQPDLLRPFLQHEDERLRLWCLMFLNFGYYQVDLARLRFEYITDFHGNPYQDGEMFITRRRERTKHQNLFTTTIYVWPETQRLMEKFRARRDNPSGMYFLSKLGTPHKYRSMGWKFFDAARNLGLSGVISIKQFRKIGASQIKSLDGSDAMHQYKANALNAADTPYIDEDYSRLTRALKIFRDKLIVDGVLVPV